MPAPNPVAVQAGPACGRLQPETHPLFLIHDASGLISNYLKLGQLGTRVYGIYDPKFDSNGLGGWQNVRDMALHYITLIKRRQPRGQILIGGWSFGGIIAVEIARILAVQGRGLTVSRVIMLDTVYPRCQRPEATKEGTVQHVPGVEGLNAQTAERLMTAVARATCLADRWIVPQWTLPRPLQESRSTSLPGQLPIPPPVILIRAGEMVVMPEENAMCVLDRTRFLPQLGWEDFHPEFISEVIQVKGNHYTLFDETIPLSWRKGYASGGVWHGCTMSAPKNEKVSWMSLPRKDQLFVLCLMRFAEPIVSASLGSFDPKLSSAEVIRQVSVLKSAFTVAQCISVLFVGKIADSSWGGRKPVLLALVLRILEGLLNGNIAIMRTMVSEIVQEKRKIANEVAVQEEMEPMVESNLESPGTPAKKFETPQKANFLPFRRMLTRNLLFTLLSYTMLETHVTAYNSLWPSFLSDPVASVEERRQWRLPFFFSGGAGMATDQIGWTLAVLGAVGLPAQLFLFPRIQQRLGNIRTLRLFQLGFPLVHALVPYIAVMPSATPPPAGKSGPYVWVLIVLVQTILMLCAVFVMPTQVMLINNASPHPSARARTHTIYTQTFLQSHPPKKIPGIMGSISGLTAAQQYEIEHYGDHRVEYPASLWALLTAYHQGPLRSAHDLGAGYGNGMEGLLRLLHGSGASLSKAILTEPKAFLIEAARARLPPMFPDTAFGYRNKKGEDPWDGVLGLESGQLDLVLSCEAIHWTDLAPTLVNINNSLRPGGTFAAVLYSPLPQIVGNTPATESLRSLVESHVNKLISESWMDEGWKRCMRQLYSGLASLPLDGDQWTDAKLVEINNVEGWWCPSTYRSPESLEQKVGAAYKALERIVIPVDANWRRTVSSPEWLKQMLVSFRLNFSDSSWASNEWRHLEQALDGQDVQLEWAVHVVLARKK
ncbi:thioesterase [Diaporthe helianthi]|uniref:Thioesterase n=1 Tax=Diaporthe helianthi TaxID=158607 RepID=A0A2P5I6I0_DIAHE|nr:thioesterase [Diaporthe helianthi]